MTIKVPYRGIIEIVGEHDTGKTIAAMQTSNNMKDIVFVDDDVKGEGTVRQMKDSGIEFDAYYDLAKYRAELSNTPTADELLSQVVFPVINEITKSKHKIIIWDTWRIVYQSARGHVERNKAKYKDVVDWTRGTSVMIQGLISKVARMIEVKMMNELKASCELLVITHHIKDNYVSNVIVGKIPESSASFSEVCNMRMWLRRNPQSKVPIILFLKRPNVPKIINNELRFTNIVPLKITPTEQHNSIWAAIAEYEKNPIESRAPRADETPTAEELAAISGTITDEQKKYIEKMLAYNERIEKELESISSAPDEVQVSPIAEQLIRIQQSSAQADDAPKDHIQLISRASSQYGFDMMKTLAILKAKDLNELAQKYSPADWDKIKAAAETESKPKKKGK